MSDVENFMRALVKARGESRPGNHYSGPEDFVLREGRSMPWREKPASVEYGRQKECFKNALHLAIATGWTYCEGYAIGHFPVEHAWVIDGDGFVIDNTWRPDNYGENPEYYGVEMDEDFVSRAVLEKGTYGLICDGKYWRSLFKEKWSGRVDNSEPYV